MRSCFRHVKVKPATEVDAQAITSECQWVRPYKLCCFETGQTYSIQETIALSAAVTYVWFAATDAHNSAKEPIPTIDCGEGAHPITQERYNRDSLD